MMNTMGKLTAAITLVFASSAIVQAQTNYNPVSVTSGTGAHPATAATFNDMPENTVYLPATLPSEQLPIVLWANGGCKDNGLGYGRFLRELSSHGYIIVAAGAPIEESKSFIERARERMTGSSASRNHQVGSADKTSAEQLIGGLDWLIDKNNEKASSLYQKIDTENVAVMGHSCGGLQAMQVATDPRLDTAIIFNSGVINEPMDVQSTALKVNKDILEKISVPLAYINGGPADIAYFNGLDDFERIQHIPVFFAENGVGHSGTFHNPNGGAYGVVARYWLDWRLKGNTKAAEWFIGSDCLLCNDMDWQVKQKQVKE